MKLCGYNAKIKTSVITAIALTTVVAVSSLFGCGGNMTAEIKKPDTTTMQNISDTVSPAVGADSISALSNDTPDTNIGSFTDPRDGKTYRTTKIGEQVWMAKNLNYDLKALVLNGLPVRADTDVSVDHTKGHLC